MEFVSGMIREMTPTGGYPNLAILKEELVEMLHSNAFGKYLGFQHSSCANLLVYCMLLHECKHA